MKVRVYFNLHDRCYSIQHKGRVVAHLDQVLITDAKFQVGEGGRQRVLKETRKNVHAYVIGEMEVGFIKKGVEVTYNPYLYKNFVTEIDKKPVRFAKRAFLSLTKDKKSKIIATQLEYL